jgi:SAM-dependent methyltransferase
MDWQEAGAAWGWRSTDWAHLVEPGNRRLFLDVLDELEVGLGDAYCDVACGSGFAVEEAQRRGADVAGLDASPALLAVAAERAPGADLRAGDITALPWPDDSFDVVTSFNGVWNVESAFGEIRRVLRPGGRFAMSFWGRPELIDLFALMPALVEFSPPEELHAGAGLLNVGDDGVAERLLCAHGLKPLRRSASMCTQEYADLELASRGLVSSGPTYPAVQAAGEDEVRSRLEQLAAQFVSADTGMVRITNEWAWITARG